MHYLFLVERYPTPSDPVYTFVRDLVIEISRNGHECSVISPQSVTRELAYKKPLRKIFWLDNYEDGKSVKVYQPFYFSFSNWLEPINNYFFRMAAKRVFRRIAGEVDVLYCHFWRMGFVALDFDTKKPLFVASGESKISLSDRDSKQIDRLAERIFGVIYVSSKNYKESQKMGLQNRERYIIAPNGINENIFYCHNKAQCRQELGIDINDYVGIFVGAFNHRKGVKRVDHATKGISDLKMIYIGDGDDKPEGDNIIHCDLVSHDRIPIYLSAADFFILPTLAEGCCNAIIEALACGLPVISSNREFNDDILDDSLSIRIDPESVEEIRNAIEKLKDVDLRNKMSEAAQKKAKDLSLKARAFNITTFVESTLIEEEKC